MTDTPYATVLAHGRGWVEVLCPYCGYEHRHECDSDAAKCRHAPGCGLTCNPDQRQTGYQFTTPSATRRTRTRR